ncbi:peptidylprolyl isomerase [Rhodonellum psychrophilum GCM71 = DSM 17998]|uniref:Peptidyl-prolyl cis-trans isomerase n=2 Tax=Rhodonellum TaxID=336827 RepID=U5BX20_9BACT|nr:MULTISPECIES: FKBP-type peptidyl-prolyl cis-trans isomerase [Rhodonellum]ERM82114.1 peptidylprolyl isomerase [Rhodonellum psychrophilum GCM71 = DSM 17998]SDY64281.1 FKBP-type peptidyl-prolyl cis-trans isomerase SlyD [Rhodonellum ikkaensis]
MKADKNKVVSVAYELHVDDGENGKVFYEKVTKDKPFEFLFGTVGLLPKFEAVLMGKSAGETFEVFIDFENGYGDYDESKRVVVPKSNFKEDGKKNKDIMKVGRVIPMQDDQGNQLRGEILKVDYKGIHMDFNPPLAGFDLYFSGEVVSVREADPEELEHGHVHGPGGHQH